MKPSVKKLTVSTLVMMITGSVISLRGLPMMAKEGLTMVFYILFSTVLFLIPAALVSAELGSAFCDKQGGIYTWVKAAFGPRWGFVAVWMQWIQNVIWYPTVLGFASGSLAYCLMKPELAGSGLYNGIVIILFYWFATFIAMRGAAAVGKYTKLGVIFGTIIPGIIIIALGGIWIYKGMPLAFMAGAAEAGNHFHPTFFPHISGLGSLAFLAGIILLFAGVEVQAVYVKDMNNPGKNFPLAVLIASLIIVLLFLSGSLAVAAVVPADQISLTSGLMEAFQQMFSRFKMPFMVPVLGFLTAAGAMGGVLAWITGPSKGLLATAQDGELPKTLAVSNSNGAPVKLLWIQGIIVTVLASLYFIMDDVSTAFFVLSAMTATLYLVMYILMYLAALKLRYSRKDLVRNYTIPGGLPVMWLVTVIGVAGVLFSLIVGFFPPDNLPVGNPVLYVSLVAGGLILFTAIPLLIHHYRQNRNMPE